MPDIRYHYKEIKTAIRKADIADFFTISKYSFSPYQACEHGCLYCDGRAEKYFVEGEFDKDIVIRKNLPDILEKEIVKLRERAFICIGSGVSDAYQPIERDACIMRKCAEILVKHDLPVVILTKSSLVLRDLDLWSQLNKRSKFLLIFSITTIDDKFRSKFEPGASSISERFEALKRFKDAGCSTGVLAMPFLPFITETPQNIYDLALAVKNTGVDFCMPGGLTLRPGVQKETFLNCLKMVSPQFINEYEKIYHQNRTSGAPDRRWFKTMQPLYQKMFGLSGLPPVIPHYIFKGLVPLYEEVYLLLALMKIAYEYRSVNTQRLQKAIELYRNWVVVIRQPIVRSRKRSFSEVDNALNEICNNGSMSNIIENKKLGEFIKKIVVDRVEFDFATMKLK